ncbi:hypothetical protein LEP1GSC029_3520 [Leptospira interrogans str. 2002000626]|uniref:Uncharacterized protein n=1 Tax=Leptospira interrogans str. 2002000626 TaxID=996803 RepID=A0A829D8J5_LEPIR|nr:hypothetical protein LEP1GSC029_3520 [Leptospira interrogans str. 2002000626]
MFKRKSFNLRMGSDLKRIGLKIKNYYSRIFYYSILFLFLRLLF